MRGAVDRMLSNLGNWGMAAEDGPRLGGLANDLVVTLVRSARRVPEVPYASDRDVWSAHASAS
jgi:hypothetical protein